MELRVCHKPCDSSNQDEASQHTRQKLNDRIEFKSHQKARARVFIVVVLSKFKSFLNEIKFINKISTRYAACACEATVTAAAAASHRYDTSNNNHNNGVLASYVFYVHIHTPACNN